MTDDRVVGRPVVPEPPELSVGPLELAAAPPELMGGHLSPPPQRGRSCLSVVGTLGIVLAVIVGTVIASPAMNLGDLRDVVRTDPLHGEPGSGGDGYTYLITTPSGSPITWPCAGTIAIEVNPEHAPKEYGELLASAISTVNESSGFTFEVVGETADRGFADKRVGSVLVGWADADEVSELSGPTAGLGGATYTQGPGGGGHAIGGTVVLDTDLPGGWLRDKSGDRELILTHELIHVLGLGHSADPTQLMAAEHRDQVQLGDGDRAGLAALREEACS